MNQYVINKQLLLSSGVRKLLVLSRPEDFDSEFHMTLAQEEELLSNAAEKVEAVAEKVESFAEEAPAIAVETTTEAITTDEDKLVTEKEEYEELKAGKVWLHGSDEKKARYKELKEIYG